MDTLIHLIQIAVALGLLNVWLVRFNRPTSYRGGEAHSMIEEFAAYGLPNYAVYVIGTLKIGTALALVAGLWLHSIVLPSAILLSLLMVGALTMHWKVRDPLKKYLPAFVMFSLSSFIFWARFTH